VYALPPWSVVLFQRQLNVICYRKEKRFRTHHAHCVRHMNASFEPQSKLQRRLLTTQVMGSGLCLRDKRASAAQSLRQPLVYYKLTIDSSLAVT